MKPHFFHRLWFVFALAIPAPVPGATSEPPSFTELYELLRSNLTGVDAPTLNRAAVDGLLKELRPRVMLLSDTNLAATTNLPALSATNVFDGTIAYLRVGEVNAALGREFWPAFTALAASNRLKGLIVDLRFADGQDYAAAAAVADRFFTNEVPLIDWGEGVRKSSTKTDAIKMPMALLVNLRTAGAAEALAAILRQNEIGLVIGSNTAGRASITKDFTLKTGQQVRVAVAPVKVAGGEAMPFTGLKPDIRVDVSADDERAWYENAYRLPSRPLTLVASDTTSTNETSQASTNRSGRRRINEADLVRMQREGQSPDELTNTSFRDIEPPKPVVRDPALVRAIDLLKGLSVMQRFRAL